jgi:lipopolysaccharide/colanic/teichoic acid biosynthesis glycosyltransferase
MGSSSASDPSLEGRDGGRSRSRRLAATAPRTGIYRNGLKRFLDIVLILLATPLVLPVIVLLALIVALDGGHPFYQQARVGRGGRFYTMWKLRTMENNAESKLANHLATDSVARTEWAATQKLRSDPRITRLGAFLRRSSLDELPQLWNVLIGDMSLVGPRPMMPDQQDLYPGEAYYMLRPGITGPWQVSERNQSSFADRARFDTAYERELSLGTDLRLLVATVGAVLRGTGC